MRNLMAVHFCFVPTIWNTGMVRYGADSKAVWLYVGMPGSVRD